MSDAGTAPYTADVDNPLCCDFARTGDRAISLHPLCPLHIAFKPFWSVEVHIICGSHFGIVTSAARQQQAQNMPCALFTAVSRPCVVTA